MKKLTFALMAAGAVVLTGCLVTSVYPFYAEKDLVFEPGLVGNRTNVKEADDHWKSEKEGSNAYRLTYRSGTNSAVMQAHLFNLRGQSFLVLFTAEASDQIHRGFSPVQRPALDRRTGLTVFQQPRHTWDNSRQGCPENSPGSGGFHSRFHLQASGNRG